jgi:hypothetical protein
LFAHDGEKLEEKKQGKQVVRGTPGT